MCLKCYKIYITSIIKSTQHNTLKDSTLNVANFTAFNSMQTLLNKMHESAL